MEKTFWNYDFWNLLPAWCMVIAVILPTVYGYLKAKNNVCPGHRNEARINKFIFYFGVFVPLAMGITATILYYVL